MVTRSVMLFSSSTTRIRCSAVTTVPPVRPGCQPGRLGTPSTGPSPMVTASPVGFLRTVGGQRTGARRGRRNGPAQKRWCQPPSGSGSEANVYSPGRGRCTTPPPPGAGGRRRRTPGSGRPGRPSPPAARTPRRLRAPLPRWPRPPPGGRSRATPTLEARPRCRRSETRPSEMSMAAEAPDSRAASPSPSLAWGRRWARTRAAAPASVGWRSPARRWRRPAADPPSGPVTNRRWPGRAPERSNGGRSGPARRVPTTDVETTRTGDSERSPPTTTQPESAAASATPAPSRSRSVPFGGGDRDQGEARPGPHGSQIGHGDHQRLVTDVVEAAQAEIDVDALDDQVSSPDDPIGRVQAEHGGVVADPCLARRRKRLPPGARSGLRTRIGSAAGRWRQTRRCRPSVAGRRSPELGLSTYLAYHCEEWSPTTISG